MKKRIFLLILFSIFDIILDLCYEILYQAYIVNYINKTSNSAYFFDLKVSLYFMIDLVRFCTIVMNIITIFILIMLLIDYLKKEVK